MQNTIVDCRQGFHRLHHSLGLITLAPLSSSNHVYQSFQYTILWVLLPSLMLLLFNQHTASVHSDL